MVTHNPLMDPSGALVADLAAIVRTAACAATQEWGKSIFLTAGSCGGKPSETLKVVILPFRPAISNELVRINFDESYSASDIEMIRTLLRLEIGPFIVGVGQMQMQDAPEGLIILRNPTK